MILWQVQKRGVRLYIDELKPASYVGVEVTEVKTAKKFFFETETLSDEEYPSEEVLQDFKKYGNHFCIVKNIMYKNKSVVFKTNGLNIALTCVVDDRSYSWKRCRLVKIPQGYLCVNQQDVQAYNRRNSYRLELLLDGVVKTEDTHPKLVMIKDVSSTGISFVVDRSFEAELGDVFRVTFQDGEYSKVKKDYVYTLYNLDAMVVRKLDSEDEEHVVVGCKVLSGFRLLESYIARKQQQSLQLSRKSPSQ